MKADFRTFTRSSDSSWMCPKCNHELFPFSGEDCLKSSSDNLSQDFIKSLSNLSYTFPCVDSDGNIDCKYYDISEFKSLAGSDKYFSYLHLNISSISKHFESFHNFLESLEHHFNVLAISESRILRTFSQPCYNIEGYHCYSTPTESQAGGTMLFLSNTLSTNRRTDLEKLVYKSKLLESTLAEINIPKQSNVVIGSIYKHPSYNIFDFDMQHIQPLIDKISKEKKTIILLGDFNINLLNTSHNENISNFLDTLGNHLILPQITLPTRITPDTKTLIDNIFTSPIKFETFSGNLTTGISDHLPQFLLIKKSFKYKNSKNIFVRDWKNFDEENFLLDFLASDWDTILALENKDPNFSFDSFFKQLSGLLNRYVPTRKLTHKEIELKQKPWLTVGIRKSIYKRDKLLKQSIKAKDEISKTNLFKQYKIYRNNIVNLIRISKQNFFKNYFIENSNNSRKIWQGINDFLLRNKNKNNNNITLNFRNENVSDPLEVANIFNNFFSSIADDIRSTIPPVFNNFKQYLKEPILNSFFLERVSISEVSRTINSLSPSKASGPNSIPPNILSLLNIDISNILSKIINLSFETGIFPSSLKLVKVIPVYKNKGSNTNFNNYRPISLLSNIDKIFEKLVHSRVVSFLDKFDLIFHKQFGFRKKHSTSHTLISLTEEIRKALDAGQFSCGVFIDLQKAFDTVDHSVLLEKLKYYGIRGIENNWFKSYLSNRNQFVFVSGEKSDIKIIKHGVPQGSVLGPLLFILYINDLKSAIRNCNTFLFADDTCLLNSNTKLKTIEKNLNYDLKMLYKWLCASKISLNITKTEVVLFHHDNKTIDHELKLKLNGKHLSLSENVKYLGITINHNLSFSQHQDSLSIKLRHANGALSKIRHVASKSVLRSVFNSLFMSHLSYGCQTWAQNINLNTNRIYKLQKSATRILTFSDFQTHSDPLFRQLNILKISEIVKLRNLILIHEALNKSCPNDIINTLNLNYHNNSHNTRSKTSKLLIKPYCRTSKFGINSITYQSITHWNEIQQHFKDTDLSQLSKSKFYQTAFEFIIDKN